MGKKLEGNGQWVSSPISEERERLHRIKPALDQKKLEEIECTLALSLRSHVRVTVVLFDSAENTLQSGFVTSIHTHSREIKLQWAEEWKWINVDDIVEAYIV
ncbi:YolD-like family protein [Paenibacillus sp. HW567]|uniref:YolD-like family protein n=1 Tax=Paenibacillus sp. HW567 TaxID=1034769 RepID=UPI00036EEA6D|nr:YolD-like family protein [Paenibacillus sp. HW567]